MRKQSIIVHHGEVHAVDQDKDAHQQAQPLPELQEHEWLVLQAFKIIYSPCDECIGYLVTH